MLRETVEWIGAKERKELRFSKSIPELFEP